MIAKIINGTSLTSSIMYNEKKVQEKSAVELESINVNNFYSSSKGKIRHLQNYADKNSKLVKNSTHIILSYTEEDRKANKPFREIAKEYLQSMGFGKQPAFLFEHTDTENPHIHIVTTPVQINGKTISDAYSKLRSNKTRKALEIKYGLVKAEERQTNKVQNIESLYTKQRLQSLIKSALRYNFINYESFSEYLYSQEIEVKKTEFLRGKKPVVGLTYQFINKKPLKASSLYFKPTYDNIQPNLKANVKLINAQIVNSKKSNLLKEYLIGEGAEIIRKKNKAFLIFKKSNLIINADELEIDKVFINKFYKNTYLPKPEEKRINILISRFYQEFKKKNKIKYESELIMNFPFNNIINHLVESHYIDDNIARMVCNSFNSYKSYRLPEIKKKEIEYFTFETNRLISFIDKLKLSADDKLKLLSMFNIGQDNNGILYSKLYYPVNYKQEIGFTNGAFFNVLPDTLNGHSLKLIKQMALGNNPSDIFIDRVEVDAILINLFIEQGLINKNTNLISPNYISLVNLDTISYENEKFLNRNHKNYTRALRGY